MHTAHALSLMRDVQAPDRVRHTVLWGSGVADGYVSAPSPLGVMHVAFSQVGVTAVAEAGPAPAFEQAYRQRFGRTVVPASGRIGRQEETAREWLLGDRRHALRFDLHGLTAFEQAVLHKTGEIPSGQIRPYSWVAREVGHPQAVRAVGSTMAKNPVPLLIPCHRVVRSDGTFGHYGLGGPRAKRAILLAEGVSLPDLDVLAKQRWRYFGSDSTHIFCFPTCRHARRASEAHRRRFKSEAEARTAGYRPCKVCRPAA